MFSREEDYCRADGSHSIIVRTLQEAILPGVSPFNLTRFRNRVCEDRNRRPKKLFVVYRSAAVIFDKGSFVIPEAAQLELTLNEALQQDERNLWMDDRRLRLQLLLALQLLQLLFFVRRKRKEVANESLRRAVKSAKDAEYKVKLERRKIKMAKEAMEASQKEQQEREESQESSFLKEEENYLKQLRAAEAAREEESKANKEAARAFDIFENYTS
ncbi:hypothetical protein IV203_023589 [Nitzschia inconspicua]|uniref:Uncharacterized protein n=1 Tax=Nitzschia inconspicua TaxID=303405 RepID=A0A9K3PCG7_9STRA|nr:hypothetical protein IV203_023589 [Nitzschia inconspicua]